MHTLAEIVAQERDRGLFTTEYWKSAPYFVNFCDGYKLGQRLREHTSVREVSTALRSVPQLRGRDIRNFKARDGGNARMRHLMQSTVDQGWWKLLWIPSSMPYFTPMKPFADAAGMTKMVVFSSWTATPTAVASLLSYEAERRMVKGSNYRHYTAKDRSKVTQHLNYQRGSRGAESMSTLLLCWPMPGLAEIADPLKLIQANGGAPLQEKDAVKTVALRIADLMPRSAPEGRHEIASTQSPWRVAFSLPKAWPGAETDAAYTKWYADALRGYRPRDDQPGPGDPDAGVTSHVDAAQAALTEGTPIAPEATIGLLSRVALHSLGNTSYRAVTRVINPHDKVSEDDLFVAAAALAHGLRSLFNRPDVIKLLERITDEAPYWQRVLQYCSLGNLQAVLDEYLHHLRADQFAKPLDSQSLFKFADTAASAVSLRASTYRALDPDDLTTPLTIVPRFALRYGGRRQEAEDARQPEIRRSFNSPFWPFVLASTSVGQEGIDFHWWCHSVFHWNIPPNPVDFEQREGRVDRYGGHAIRKNIAEVHAKEILSQPGRDPWATAFDMAQDFQSEYGDFSPYWVYPGSARIERHFAPFPLSKDQAAYERVKQDVALYRLTLGQQRQEDMIELLRRRGMQSDPKALDALRIDLAP